MAKNLLPQSLGMKPGTSLIGQFGSTEMRFRPPPTNENPGPGAYGAGGRGPSTRLVLSSELKGGWAPGTALGHVLDLGMPGPGPGAHGTEQHWDSLVTEQRKRWPGIPSKSSFLANSVRECNKPTPINPDPGPGAYNQDNTYHFTSKATGARSPFLAQARAASGSRLLRDMDMKEMAIFSSKSAAHKMPDNNSGAAIDAPRDFPGPGAHTPAFDTVAVRYDKQMRNVLMRSDGGLHTSFHSTAERFKEKEGAAELPGPGAHTIGRWNAEIPANRRPRPAPSVANGSAFLSSDDRFRQKKEHLHTDAVVQFLAYGPEPPGQPTNAQFAMQRVASEVRSVPRGRVR